MNAVPKIRLSGDVATIRVNDGPLPGVWVECEVAQPPSQIGKSVNVFFDQEMVTKLLLEFKDFAIQLRRKGHD